MKRFPMATVLAIFVVQGVSAAYQARLLFYDSSTGKSNSGELIARPGDQIEVWYTFHALDTVNPYKWGTLQATLCLDGLRLISAADQATWADQIQNAKVQSGALSDFMATVIGNGPLYDNAIDPSDVTSPLISSNGLYVLLGIHQVLAQHWDAMLYRFTIAPGTEGDVLGWCLDGRDAGTGLSTRILDQKNRTVDVTDNWIHVVPEPGSLFAFGILLALLRKRKEP